MKIHVSLMLLLGAIFQPSWDKREAFCQPAATMTKPNVILIISDDQGYGDMSCHGNPWLKTPYIDKLYRESARFTDFHVSPTCAPTRAALMTGHYSNRTGVWHTIAGRSLLREGEITMADVFSENGYATGIFGKWHLGDNYPFRPQDRGFDEVLIHGGGGVGQGPDYWNNDYFDDHYLYNGKPTRFPGYCTDVWFDEAIGFIDRKSTEGKPFFCYLSTNAPHSPYYVEDKYLAAYQRNDSIAVPAFNAMISNFDENLGRLLGYLDRNRLTDNTLLIFMTDNGTSAGVRFKDGKVDKGYNAGMRGQKGSMYEGGHRVPCFMRWPDGGIIAGKDVLDLTAHVDLLPTMIDLLQLKVPDDIQFDGTSLKSVVTGPTNSLPARTLITDSQRLEQPEKWRQSAVMRGPWRLINGDELYDIQKDPGQVEDVAQGHPKIVRELRQAYELWWRDISPVFKEAPAIALCPPQEPVTVIRAHDMHMDAGYDLVPWNHDQIRDGMKSNGWYAVQALESGIYRFKLMRWPPESGANIREALPSLPGVQGTTVRTRREGRSLNIREAGLSIGNVSRKHAIDTREGNAISFDHPLEEGQHQLRAWFVDDNGEQFAAYYLSVERIK